MSLQYGVCTDVVARSGVLNGKSSEHAIHVSIELVRQARNPEGVEAGDQRRVPWPESRPLAEGLVQHPNIPVVQVVLRQRVAVLGGIVVVNGVAKRLAVVAVGGAG